LGYIIVPAVGPRFSQISQMPTAIPGLWLAPRFEESFKHVAFLRDCFPSGHTCQTLVVMWFSLRYLNRRYAAAMLVIGCSIITATLYCRMHYGIDLLAAVPLACFGIVVGELLVRRTAGAYTVLDLSKYPLTKLWRY
jgi:membrane-associated phospholipid phosphatase